MTIWIIEPHDPLIVRDGKPFGPNPGALANSLPFPFPSTTTGGVRTRAGLDDNGVFIQSKTNIDAVKKIKVRGPLLVEYDALEGALQWMVPAPHDALLLPGIPDASGAKDAADAKPKIKQLVPLNLPIDVMTNLDPALQPVGMPNPDKQDKDKPLQNPPRFWYWKHFETWLLHPERLAEMTLGELGHHGPQRERRIHVSIDPEKLTNKDGALFGTSGLEFSSGKPDKLSSAKQLALAVSVDSEVGEQMPKGLAGFAGERRIVSWRQSNQALPTCPDELVENILKHKACRLILITPGYFSNGYTPAGSDVTRKGVTPHLTGIAVKRPEVVSGWDLAIRKPKPSRRLAPAGTVLFLKFDENTDETAIRDWIDDIWMKCVGDSAACNDGFGLAVLGILSETPETKQEG